MILILKKKETPPLKKPNIWAFNVWALKKALKVEHMPTFGYRDGIKMAKKFKLSFKQIENKVIITESTENGN